SPTAPISQLSQFVDFILSKVHQSLLFRVLRTRSQVQRSPSITAAPRSLHTGQRKSLVIQGEMIRTHNHAEAK
ncbi:mCG140491, isoform CRA_b, partial [Mus musculus]